MHVHAAIAAHMSSDPHNIIHELYTIFDMLEYWAQNDS